jgi:type IV pilus assembly protein PilQ
MEVHPELSTGNVRIEGGFTLPDKEVTEVTTNIMVRDGGTLVIGGLMREELDANGNQVPLLGSAPWIGFLFRNRTETTERREIIVLVTPHIVYDPYAYAEGDKAACEFHRRQLHYADHMSPIGTRYLGRKYFRIAQDAWAAGDKHRALKYVGLSLSFDPLNRAALDLRGDVYANNHFGDHSGPVPPNQAVGPAALDSQQLAPWLLDSLQGEPCATDAPGYEQGVPGSVRPIVRPEALQ